MSKEEKMNLIKRHNKNNLTNICRFFKIDNSALYHLKYKEKTYDEILVMIKSRNEVINSRIDEVLKNG